MIFSFILLFLMLLLICFALFYLFCFFIPALQIKYEGINNNLASDFDFSNADSLSLVKPDFSKIAQIKNKEVTEKRLSYKGEKNCKLFNSIYSSEYKDTQICIGFGDCVKVCPQHAIEIENDKAVISTLCNGCGLCINSCPINIISLVERKDENFSKSDKKDFKFWYSCYKLLKRH